MTGLPEGLDDDPDIAGQVRLLRRVPDILVRNGEIESSIFDERAEGEGLSVTVWAGAQDLEDILRGHEGFGVICITADVVRKQGGSIVRAPLEGNANHCEVYPRFTKGQRKALKKSARWVCYPDAVPEEVRGPTVSITDDL